MIEFNDYFKAEKDSYQWILHARHDGKTRDGAPKEVWTQTYHGTLQQVCYKIADKIVGTCDNVQDVVKAYEEFSMVVESLNLENNDGST